MSKFAPVAPADIIEQLDPDTRGNYHLILAHDVVQHPEVYHRVYNIFGMTVIMDNSVIELGKAVDLQMIGEAVKITGATTIVLPDVLEDADATIESIREAYPAWKEYFTGLLGDGNDWGFMIAPQGETIQDFARCADFFADYRKVNFWGVPRNVVKLHGSRREAIKIVQAVNHHRKVHLFGFSDNIVDDVLCARMYRVSGIDSAVPLRAASLGKDMSFDLMLPRRGTWWGDVKFVPQMNTNIRQYTRWLRP